MDYQTLGQSLSALRRENGVSQQKMAEDIGISRATINAFENNRSGDIGIRKVMKMFDYLGKELSIRDTPPFPTFEELLREQ